jgi:hypothetical protein
MFGKLFSKKHKLRKEGDKGWVTHEQKVRGLCKIAQNASHLSESVVVIAHFEQSFQELMMAFNVNRIAYESIATLFDQAALKAQIFQPTSGKVILILREFLPQLPTKEQLGIVQHQKSHIRLIGLERHFLRCYDDEIENWASTIPLPTSLEFHLAFDEPLYCFFVGMDVNRMLTALKLPEGECISSSLISQTIKDIQKKIALRVKENKRALSADEWLKSNLPDWQPRESL